MGYDRSGAGATACGHHHGRARTGCDLQRVDDVADAIRDFGARYLDRVYTAAEQASYAAGGAVFAGRPLRRQGGGAQADRHRRRGRPAQRRDRPSATGRPEVHLTGLAAELAREARDGPASTSASVTLATSRSRSPSPSPTPMSSREHDTRMTPAVTDTIRSILAEHARLGVDVASLSDTDDLYGAGHDLARLGHRDAGLRGRVGHRVPPAPAQEEHVRLGRRNIRARSPSSDVDDATVGAR